MKCVSALCIRAARSVLRWYKDEAGFFQQNLSRAKRNIRRSDKARASYYRHISGKRWGDAGNYELVVDSSVGVEKSAELILDYVSNEWKIEQ